MQLQEIVWNVESQMLDNIMSLLMRGSVGSAEWTLQKLQALGVLQDLNRRAIKKNREGVILAVREAIEQRARPGVKQVEVAAKKLGKDIVPDERVAMVLSRWASASGEKLEKMYGHMLRSAGDVYVRTVQEASARVALGESGRKAVAQVTKQWAADGLPGLVDKAGRMWTPEAYAEVIVRSSTVQATTEAQIARMEDMDLDLIEVSSHVGARPLCEPWQGKVLSLHGKTKGYTALADTSYGDPAGLFGINCGHMFYAYEPGTEKTYSPYPAKENKEAYKNSQKQRAYERSIRKAKRALEEVKKTGVQSEIDDVKQLVSQRQKSLRDFINTTGRRRDYGREQIGG